MAKIDPIRRAQIGLGRRAKSRSLLMQAARALYSARAIHAVTVDDVTLEAGVAKGPSTPTSVLSMTCTPRSRRNFRRRSTPWLSPSRSRLTIRSKGSRPDAWPLSVRRCATRHGAP
jgi:hypothetical protein